MADVVFIIFITVFPLLFCVMIGVFAYKNCKGTGHEQTEEEYFK